VEDILTGIFDPPKVDYLMNILRKFKERYKSKVWDIRNPDDPHLIFDYDAKKNKDRCELVIAQNYKNIAADINGGMHVPSDDLNLGGAICSHYFFSNILSIFLIGSKTSFTNYHNCEFSNIRHNSDDLGILISIERHSCCFFVCNGVEKYYNDNDDQIIDCKWKEMLKKTSKNNCLYVQEKGCVLLLTDEEYNMRLDKSKLYKIEMLSVLSKTWRPNSFDNDMQHLIKGNYGEIKDVEINYIVGEWYNRNYDIENAIKHFKIAADLGNIDARIILGLHYKNKSISTAITHFKIAVDNGDSRAMVNLGQIYEREPYVKNISEAIKYYKMAVDNGDSRAMKILGHIYEMKPGVKNISEAIKYYKMAVDNGDSFAMRILGQIYETEPDVKNISEAIKYYKMAVDRGDSYSAKRLQILESNS
jgi:TPR repeat protein